MRGVVLSMLAVVISAASLCAVPTARADDPTCNDLDDDCVIVNIRPGGAAASQPSEGSGETKPKKKVVPQCSAFSGPTVTVPSGTPVDAMLPEDQPEPGSVRITCLLDGE